MLLMFPVSEGIDSAHNVYNYRHKLTASMYIVLYIKNASINFRGFRLLNSQKLCLVCFENFDYLKASGIQRGEG